MVETIHKLEGDTQLDIYQYGTYRTSLSYYLGRTTTYLDEYDPNNVWDHGKNIMPIVSPSRLETDNALLSRALIYVSHKELDSFKKQSLYGHVKAVETDAFGVYFRGK